MQIIEEPLVGRTCKGEKWQLGQHRLLIKPASLVSNLEELTGRENFVIFTDPGSAFISTEVLQCAQSVSIFVGVEDLPLMFDVFQEKISEMFCWKKPYDITEISKSSELLLNDIEYLLWIPLSGRKINSRNKEPIANRSHFILDVEHTIRGMSSSKPLSLYENHLMLITEVEEVVVDLYAKHGDILLACEKMGRICYSLESDEKQADLLIKRYESATGQKARMVEEWDTIDS